MLNTERVPELRVEAIWALGYMGSKAAAADEALRIAEDDPYEAVAKAATETIKKMHTFDGNPGAW